MFVVLAVIHSFLLRTKSYIENNWFLTHFIYSINNSSKSGFGVFSKSRFFLWIVSSNQLYFFIFMLLLLNFTVIIQIFLICLYTLFPCLIFVQKLILAHTYFQKIQLLLEHEVWLICQTHTKRTRRKWVHTKSKY